MIDIKFTNDHDAIFMLIMIFVHDFLHDFNAVNFSSRLKTIRKSIEDFSKVIKGELPLGSTTSVSPTTPSVLEFLPTEELEGPPPSATVAPSRRGDTRGRGTGKGTGRGTGRGHGGYSQQYGGSKDGNVEHQENYNGFEEGNTISILRKWSHEYKGVNSKMAANVDRFIGTSNTTIMRASLIQYIIKYIDESKMYVLGYANSKKSKGGRDVVVAPQRNAFTIFDDLKKYEAKPPIHDGKIKVETKIRISPEKGKFQSHCEHVRFAFDTAINTAYDPESKNYFRTMKQFYLCYEDTNKNPYLAAFDNPHVDNALMVYLLNVNDNSVTLDNAPSIAKSLNKVYFNYFKPDTEYEGGFFQGGDEEEELTVEILTNISSNFQFIQTFIDEPNNKLDDYYSTFVNFSRAKQAVKILETEPNGTPEVTAIVAELETSFVTVKGLQTLIVEKVINKVKENKKLLKKINPSYNTVRDVLINAYRTISTLQLNGRQKIPRTFIHDIENYLTAVKEYLVFVHNKLEAHKRYLEYKAMEDAERADSGSLTEPQKNNVQMVSVTVARGGKKFIIGEGPTAKIDFNLLKKPREKPAETIQKIAEFKRRYNNNTVLLKECQIIDDSINNNRVAGTIDEEIRNAFIEYANQNHPTKLLLNLKSMKKMVELKRKEKGKKIIAVNNAATSALELLGVGENERICPLSSIADAQGIFGSCFPTILPVQKEYHPMDFQISNNTGSIFYKGKTTYSQRGKNINTQITFEAQANDFKLTPVVLNLDFVEESHVLELSANKTFKTLLSKILDIWDKYIARTPSTSPEVLWEKLIETPVIFSELVSSGAVKSVGDLFQEINSVAKVGGYSNVTTDEFNNEFRIGANGDQPSGVRAGFIALNACPACVHNDIMAGYLSTNRQETDLNTGSFVIVNDVVSANTARAARGGTRKYGRRRYINNKTRKYY